MGPDEKAELALGLDLDCLMRSSRDMSRPLDMVVGLERATGSAVAEAKTTARSCSCGGGGEGVRLGVLL